MLDVYEGLRVQVREVADVFVGLFMGSVWRRYVDEGMPEERLAEVQSVVERLHPAAVQTLLAVFRGAMAEAVDEAIGTELAACRGRTSTSPNSRPPSPTDARPLRRTRPAAPPEDPAVGRRDQALLREEVDGLAGGVPAGGGPVRVGRAPRPWPPAESRPTDA